MIGPVLASGATPSGSKVELCEFGDAVSPAEGSTWDDWGSTTRDGPPRALARLLVVRDGVPAGSVSWHLVSYGATIGSQAWNIGIGLADSARGNGVGTVAQRLLACWLLDTTELFRIEASTDVGNLPEQYALSRAGFTCEGVARSAQLRADGRHDLYVYSFLRSDR
jgi:RimJ/RimL family protein N-acetyltransferase